MYISKTYQASLVTDAFVRYSPLDNTYYFCERGSDRIHDIRQGIIGCRHIPKEVKQEAKARAGVYPSYVPIDKEITIKWGFIKEW